MGWSLVIIAMRDGSPPVLSMPNSPTAKPEGTYQQRQACADPGKRSPYIHHDACVLSRGDGWEWGSIQAQPSEVSRGEPMWD